MGKDDRVVNRHSLALHSGRYVERYNAKPIDRVSNLVPLMNLTRNSRVVDYACGNGMLLQAMDDQFGTYDGVDFSPDFIAAANNWAAKTGRTRYAFHCCDIRDYCEANVGRFDVGATLDFSEHIDDVLAVSIYSAIRKSICPGGRLYLHTPNLGFFMERARKIGLIKAFPEHVAVRNASHTVDILTKSGFKHSAISVRIVPHYNILKLVHPLSKLPFLGELFSARLWIEAKVT